MTEQQQARFAEIMSIARRLSWFYQNRFGYPTMEGSEVEKCILMAIDDSELVQFREAARNREIVRENRRANPDHV